jgi:hypothetical protein
MNGDYAAIKSNQGMTTGGNRDRLLALAVSDFKSAPEKPSHVDVVRLPIAMGAKQD